jgi:hypothetical protein
MTENREQSKDIKMIKSARMTPTSRFPFEHRNMMIKMRQSRFALKIFTQALREGKVRTGGCGIDCMRDRWIGRGCCLTVILRAYQNRSGCAHLAVSAM